MPIQASQYVKILEFDKIKDRLQSWMRFVIISLNELPRSSCEVSTGKIQSKDEASFRVLNPHWGIKTGAVIFLRSFLNHKTSRFLPELFAGFFEMRPFVHYFNRESIRLPVNDTEGGGSHSNFSKSIERDFQGMTEYSQEHKIMAAYQ